MLLISIVRSVKVYTLQINSSGVYFKGLTSCEKYVSLNSPPVSCWYVFWFVSVLFCFACSLCTCCSVLPVVSPVLFVCLFSCIFISPFWQADKEKVTGNRDTVQSFTYLCCLLLPGAWPRGLKLSAFTSKLDPFVKRKGNREKQHQLLLQRLFSYLDFVLPERVASSVGVECSSLVLSLVSFLCVGAVGVWSETFVPGSVSLYPALYCWSGCRKWDSVGILASHTSRAEHSIPCSGDKKECMQPGGDRWGRVLTIYRADLFVLYLLFQPK